MPDYPWNGPMIQPYHWAAGVNRPQADDPATRTYVTPVDAVDYVVGCTGRERGLVSSLMTYAKRNGAVFVAHDKKQPHTRSVVMVKQPGPCPVNVR